MDGIGRGTGKKEMSNDNTRRSQRSQATGDYRRQEVRRVPRTGATADKSRMQAQLHEQMRRQMQARMRRTGTTGQESLASPPDGRSEPSESLSRQAMPSSQPMPAPAEAQTDMGTADSVMPMADSAEPATGDLPDAVASPTPDDTDGTAEVRQPKPQPSRQSMDAAMRRQMMSMMRENMARRQGVPKGVQPQGQPRRSTPATNRLPETDIDDFFDDGGSYEEREAVNHPRPRHQPEYRDQPSWQPAQPRQASVNAYAHPVDMRTQPAQGGQYGIGMPVGAGGGYGGQGPQGSPRPVTQVPSPQPQAWHQPAQAPSHPQVPPEVGGTPGKEIQQESLASRILGNTLTFSMTLSMVLTPFAFLYVLQPDLMNRILELPFPIIAPIALVYILTMLFLGMRLAAIFGCGPWYRVMARSSEDG